MKLIKHWRKLKGEVFHSNKELDFKAENLELLVKTVTELKGVLTRIGTSLGQQELTNILASALKKDATLFKSMC